MIPHNSTPTTLSNQSNASANPTPPAHFDVAIIGSGFGGAVTALRLTEKGYRVAVIEAGERFEDKDFPTSNWDLKKYLWAPHLGCFGIQRIHLLNNVMVLAGAGVGGGSLNYANTLYQPPSDYFQQTPWATITDWEAELLPYYEQGRRMLGVINNPTTTPSDSVIRRAARSMGIESSMRPTPVGVFMGAAAAAQPGAGNAHLPSSATSTAPGDSTADPYFGGAGPRRTACTECGECMTGCRWGSKNTLMKNYLYLAEQAGARIIHRTTVTDLQHNPATGTWTLTTTATGSWRPSKHQRYYTAERVVMAAGAWGTHSLLHRVKARGHLPHMSHRLGHLARTNSEVILGASAKHYDPHADYSRGVAITSSIFPNSYTHIQPVRYGKGSNAMALLQMVQTDGSKALPRALQALGKILTHPWEVPRLYKLKQWSQRTVILLVMQNHNNSLTTYLKRRGPFSHLASTQGEGSPNPTWIPEGNAAATATAQTMSSQRGGHAIAGGAISELINSPLTAHFIGGAVISSSPDTGVIDPYQRVWGHPTLSIHDGSALAANPGVNPSLSIVALAERACALWPNKNQEDPRPHQGEPYRVVQAVPPDHPTVPADAPAALNLGMPAYGGSVLSQR